MTRSPSTPPPRSPLVPLLLGAGILIALLGVASLTQLFLLGAAGHPLEGVYPWFREGGVDLAVPGVALLLAAVPLVIGELLRRARWNVGYKGFFRGGTVSTTSRPLPLWATLVWAIVASAAWVVLIPVPVLGDRGAFADASDGFWTLVGIYGFVAAALAGVLLLALGKRAVFADARRRKRVAPARGRAFWQFVSGQWRVESWCVGIGVALLGVTPLLSQGADGGDYDTTALIVLCSIGGVLVVAGVVLALGSWRTGKGIGYAESVA